MMDVNRLTSTPSASVTREALDHAGPKGVAEDEQDQAGDQRGNVSIPDGWPGPAPAQVDGLAQGPAGPQLLFQPLEDQDVGVHCHADTQDETGDAGQG